jgi:cbb3-type cytochrome oxidase subunit 3
MKKKILIKIAKVIWTIMILMVVLGMIAFLLIPLIGYG